MTVLAPLPGDPSTIGLYGSRYESFAEIILATARRLGDFVDDNATIGKSIDAVRTEARAVDAAIVAVQPRYRETALALTEYSVALMDAQDGASSAIRRATAEQDAIAPLEHRKTQLEHDKMRAMLAMTIPPTDTSDLDRELHQVEAQLALHHAQYQAAAADYAVALSERDIAAAKAIARIQPVLDQMNDHFLDYVQSALDTLGDIAGAVAHWIDNVLVPILLEILLVVELIGFVLTAAAAVLLLLPVLLALLGSGAIDFGTLVDHLIAGLLVVLPLLVPAVALILAREAATPTPKMDRLTPYLGDAVHRDSPLSYENQLKFNAKMDNEGGTQQTKISVVEVLDENGNRVGWRVTLPSTQDWELLNGVMGGHWDQLSEQGGVNDLGSNLALMLTPEQKDAYERAVIDAMQQAGVGPDDPVMLTGWSQGGILAGAMASDPTVPFNIKAIFVAGAPIDAMDIPQDVSVISIQHEHDVVPQLDGVPAAPNTSHWVTITAPSPDPANIHNSGTYATTAGQYLDSVKNPSDDLKQVLAAQSEFFSDNEVEHEFSGHE